MPLKFISYVYCKTFSIVLKGGADQLEIYNVDKKNNYITDADNKIKQFKLDMNIDG